MESKFFCCFTLIITSYITGVTSLTLTSSANPQAVGGNVTLTLNPLMNITIGTWSFNGNFMLIWFPNQLSVNENYKGRISFNLSTNQITLYSVQVSDSGLYKLQGMEPNLNVELTQSVQVPITNVSLTVSKTNLVEFNGSVVFTCTGSGTLLAITWYNDSSVVTAANNQVYINGSSLIISNVTRYDSGPFRCSVANGISNGTSRSISLDVSYGPLSTRISGPAIAEVGSNVTLNCSASSQPASQYSWFFQGSKVAEGSVYQGYSLSLNSSGEYTCLAHNNITGGNSSATWNLTVIVGISSVVVTPSTLSPLASKDMQLFCNVTGSFNTIQWLKDNQPLNTAATKSMYINGTTVDFQPLQITDDGSYTCVATNAFRPHVSLPFILIVNYGPVDVTITADIKAATILMCNAKSQPPSVYHWLFNNTVIKEDAILILPLMPPLGYNYTCVAINPLTNDTLSTSYVISERNAAAPLQTSMLLTALCALVLLLMLMKPF
ncbi:carcinoembryonic antigen-related cell adhesion molecule 5-like [Hemibagrus wyckioides]|uniref:carcinoembryonic antigen-related cell adhesion molecule 5-like n=1 Tax=Hemibagrus wyckioides TaxID=337641 RepID=UPI00266CC362|nr:carcinoembryonic antigen-related cell adhesion molecule 5-like [Hemibagrus wyckioides]